LRNTCHSQQISIPINNLEWAQNNLARIVCERGGRTSAAPLLQSPNWLPVQHSITNKTAVLTHKFLMTSAPSYLSDMLHTVAPVRQLRSPLLIVPCTQTDIAGCTFSVAAPSVWKSASQHRTLETETPPLPSNNILKTFV